MKRSMMLVLAVFAGGCVETGSRDDIDSVSSALNVAGGTFPVISSRGVGNLEVFAMASNGTGLNVKTYDGSWHDWQVIPYTGIGYPVPVGSPAATSWSSTRTDVFMRDSYNNLQHVYRNTGGWSSWETVGSGVYSSPAVTNWGSGRLDVFYLDNQSHLQHLWYQEPYWYGPEALFTNVGFASPPAAVSWAPGRIDIVAASTGGNVNQYFYSNPQGWFGPFGLGGAPNGNGVTMGITSWGVNRLDVFVGNGMWVQRRSYTGSSWDPSWTNVLLEGGVSANVSAVSWGTNRIDIVSRDSSGIVQQAYSNTNPPAFSSWFGL
jgi:hypothetical protein